MYTGTLIENLIAAVERAEAKVREAEVAETMSWLATAQDSMEYDPKLLGVA